MSSPATIFPNAGEGSSVRLDLSRAVAALLLSALALYAANLPLQRERPLLASFLLAVAVLAASFPYAAPIALFGLLPIVPILGTLTHGPAFSPSEAMLLVAGAALGLRALATSTKPVEGSLGGPLAVATATAFVSATTALLASLPTPLLQRAVADAMRSFHSIDASHAAVPLRSAVVVAIGLGSYVAVRRSLERVAPSCVLLVLVLAGCFVAVYGGVEAASGLRLWPAGRYEPATGLSRVVSTLPDYNATAAFLLLAGFAALGPALSGSIPALFGAGIAAIGLLLTGSRSGWIAAAGGLALLAVVDRRRKKLLLPIGLAVVGMAFWPGSTGTLVRDRVAGLLSPHHTADAIGFGRAGFWRAGARMVAEEPFCGVGIGRAPARLAEFRDPELPITSENLHSYPLQAIAENGIPGGILLLWAFPPLLLRIAIALRSGSANTRSLAIGLLAFCAAGLVAHPWLVPELSALFWATAALFEVYLEGDLGESVLRGRRATTILGFVLLVGWGVARLLLVTGSEPGRSGYGAWGWDEGHGRRMWVGRSAVVPLPVPPGVRAGILPFRRGPERPGGDVRLKVRFEGGKWTRLSLPDPSWHELRVALPDPLPAARGGGPRRILLEIRAEPPFCPGATGDGDDRRVLAVEMGRPRGEG